MPGFWRSVLTGHRLVSRAVQPHDEDLLTKIVDIRTTGEADSPSFTLAFHFEADNGYFEDTVLSKRFEVAIESDGAHRVVSVTSTRPKWLPDRNVGVDKVTRKQRHKTKGTRTVTREEPRPSFFQFFDTPDLSAEDLADPEDGGDGASVSSERLEAHDVKNERAYEDLEFAEIIREKLIPEAYDWFTGRGMDEDYMPEEDSDEEESEDFSSDDEGFQFRERGAGGGGRGGRGGRRAIRGNDDDDDDEDDSDEEDSDDEDYAPKGGKGGKGGAGPQQPECKQS